MVTVNSINELQAAIANARQQGLTIGFVPTMGALHQGHASLVKQAKESSGFVVASVYVNPAQFNDPADLERYPRTPEADQALLASAGCALAFFPSLSEMMDGAQEFSMDFGHLETVMEGKVRPGHFKGMAMIVSRFFDIVQPDFAYFGEKDFQQLVIVQEMVRQQQRTTRVIGCPTVREADGLAMSSRNIRLTAAEREQAPVIYRSMLMASEMVREIPVKEAHDFIRSAIEDTGLFKLEYADFVDAVTLQPIDQWDPYHQQRICVAVQASATRLIDNIGL